MNSNRNENSEELNEQKAFTEMSLYEKMGFMFDTNSKFFDTNFTTTNEYKSGHKIWKEYKKLRSTNDQYVKIFGGKELFRPFTVETLFENTGTVIDLSSLLMKDVKSLVNEVEDVPTLVLDGFDTFNILENVGDVRLIQTIYNQHKIQNYNMNEFFQLNQLHLWIMYRSAYDIHAWHCQVVYIDIDGDVMKITVDTSDRDKIGIERTTFWVHQLQETFIFILDDMFNRKVKTAKKINFLHIDDEQRNPNCVCGCVLKILKRIYVSWKHISQFPHTNANVQTWCDFIGTHVEKAQLFHDSNFEFMLEELFDNEDDFLQNSKLEKSTLFRKIRRSRLSGDVCFESFSGITFENSIILKLMKNECISNEKKLSLLFLHPMNILLAHITKNDNLRILCVGSDDARKFYDNVDLEECYLYLQTQFHKYYNEMLHEWIKNANLSLWMNIFDGNVCFRLEINTFANCTIHVKDNIEYWEVERRQRAKKISKIIGSTMEIMMSKFKQSVGWKSQMVTFFRDGNHTQQSITLQFLRNVYSIHKSETINSSKITSTMRLQWNYLIAMNYKVKVHTPINLLQISSAIIPEFPIFSQSNIVLPVVQSEIKLNVSFINETYNTGWIIVTLSLVMSVVNNIDWDESAHQLRIGIRHKGQDECFDNDEKSTTFSQSQEIAQQAINGSQQTICLDLPHINVLERNTFIKSMEDGCVVLKYRYQKKNIFQFNRQHIFEIFKEINRTILPRAIKSSLSVELYLGAISQQIVFIHVPAWLLRIPPLPTELNVNILHAPVYWCEKDGNDKQAIDFHLTYAFDDSCCVCPHTIPPKIVTSHVHRWIEQGRWIPVGYLNWWIKRNEKPEYLNHVQVIKCGVKNSGLS